jgi:hypothetical protein
LVSNCFRHGNSKEPQTLKLLSEGMGCISLCKSRNAFVNKIIVSWSFFVAALWVTIRSNEQTAKEQRKGSDKPHTWKMNTFLTNCRGPKTNLF